MRDEIKPTEFLDQETITSIMNEIDLTAEERDGHIFGICFSVKMEVQIKK